MAARAMVGPPAVDPRAAAAVARRAAAVEKGTSRRKTAPVVAAARARNLTRVPATRTAPGDLGPPSAPARNAKPNITVAARRESGSGVTTTTALGREPARTASLRVAPTAIEHVEDLEELLPRNIG